MKQTLKQHSAFTLVELSIVLVILGLLVGGVLSGQSLIRAAELRSIATEKDKYAVALNAFQDKYFALPGDMKNAFAFWGSDCGTDTREAITGCNGDGDGVVEHSTGDGLGGEHLFAWEHLSLAGLIEGSFDGSGGGDGYELTRTAVPAAKFPQAFWNLRYSPYEQVPLSAAENNGRSLVLGIGAIVDSISEDGWVAPLSNLSNQEAWNLDTKMDDGRATTGTMRGNYPACSDDGADHYMIVAEGADATGNCILGFMIKR